MKMYKKEYENVFQRDMERRCNIKKVSTFKNNPEGIDNYIKLYQETFEDIQKQLFDNLVKLVWLDRRFCYNRKRAIKAGRNGLTIDRAKSLFVRNFVGFDPKFFLMSNAPFLCVSRYFDDFFPNFNEGNPFEEEYKYPYKYMKLEALVTVGQMPEKMDLLEHGEKNKMPLEEFKDFVINYINCYNEEHGLTYLYKFPSGFLSYVSFCKKK